MSDNLLPCPLPWCGAPARMMGKFHVCCTVIDCPLEYADVPIEDWNRRTGIAGMVPEGWKVVGVLANYSNTIFTATLDNSAMPDPNTVLVFVTGTGATIEEAVAQAVRGIGK